MGLLYMDDLSEHPQHEKYIAEAAKLLGQSAKLYQVASKESDLQNDKLVDYHKPVDINILLDSNPTTVLKRMNWFSEDDELPYVAYITSLADNLEDPVVIEKECLVELSTKQTDSYNPTKFIITSVRGSKLNPLYWICKLVPYRLDSVIEENPKEEVEEGYSYIKRSGD